MTICALLLARQFYDLQPSTRLKYATLGLLFVNVSIGGTLTHFAAPPILMVARPWGWDTAFVMGHFGWRAVLAILASNALYLLVFRRELAALALLPAGAGRRPTRRRRRPHAGGEPAAGAGMADCGPPAFMAWTVLNAHYPALFIWRLPDLPRLRQGDRARTRAASS